VGLFRLRKRRQEVAEWLLAPVDKHPTATLYVAWETADIHVGDAIEARGLRHGRAVGPVVLANLHPGLNPIEMRWRQFRREGTHGEFFASLDTLLKAVHPFFDRYNQYMKRVQSIIGAHAP
jgi:hypothetical protein